MVNCSEMIKLSLHAMATRFELVLYGDDSVRLRAAGEQAFEEIERLESQLSFYRSDSEITWLNSQGARGWVKVDPRLFRLLLRCAHLSEKTCGAFDVTIGPLMRAWGFAGSNPNVPQPDILAAAERRVGMGQVEFDQDDFTIRFKQPGVELDLGGYGKGYAVERAISILKENGIRSALLHGGTSSVFAIGAPPLDTSWKVALGFPLTDGAEPPVIELYNAGLSVSAAHGKWFIVDDREHGHVMDPRTGEPVKGAAVVTGPSPADCEALSTALLVLGPRWLPAMGRSFPGYEGTFAPS
jgi:FAD:protein FMN transferase